MGQEIFEPVSFESAVMCWPQMGHANLNSLMAQKFTPESRRSRAQSLVESLRLTRMEDIPRATMKAKLKFEDRRVPGGKILTSPFQDYLAAGAVAAIAGRTDIIAAGNLLASASASASVDAIVPIMIELS